MWWFGLGVLVGKSQAADPAMATSMGEGGVSRANTAGMGAILTAPALIALTPRYEVAGGGRIGTSKIRRLEAAALDSTTGPVALGLAFIKEGASFAATADELPGWLEPGEDTINPYTETTFGGGLAFSFLNRHLAMGLTARYERYSSRFADQEDAFQGGLSVAGQVGGKAFLSLSAEDLVPSDDVDPGIGTGLRWQPTERFGIELDTLTRLGESTDLAEISAGMEAFPVEALPLRAGFRREALTGADYATAGIGIASEEASLDYAVSLQLGAWEHAHALSLRLFF